MIDYYLESLILAFIQGFTEFIPVSSSAHLIVVSKLYEFQNNSLEIDVGLHLGSFLIKVFPVILLIISPIK